MKTEIVKKAIKSFVCREGRMTPGQSKALEELWPRYGVSLSQGTVDFESLFARKSPTVLEIGFGMGSSLLEMAAAQPDRNYIGIEVHRPGVGALLMGMEARQVDNIRIYQTDACEVLKQAIPEASLAGVQIFFPDPWPKTRHHKRRLIQPEFVSLLVSKLTVGGFIHFATDWSDYAHQALEVLEACSLLENAAGKGQFLARPDFRPVTKFERRGLALGHAIFDVMMLKD